MFTNAGANVRSPVGDTSPEARRILIEGYRSRLTRDSGQQVDRANVKSPTNDTSPEAERILIEGYRSMPAWRKLRQVTALTQTAQRMALTRLREQYGPMSEREERLRLAALWLPRETMVRLFCWDPEEKGY